MSVRTLRQRSPRRTTAIVEPRRPCAQPNCGRLTRSGLCPDHARQREQQRPNADIRRWYHTPRWRELRARVLREEPWCASCAAGGVRRATTDADHITAHRGDPALFWNRANLHGLCHAHHAQKTGRGD